MDKHTWPIGIRPSPTGIRIRIWRDRKIIFTETVKGDAYNARDLAAAVKRRKYLESRIQVGLPVYEGDQAEHLNFTQVAQEYLDSLDAKHSTHLSYENILNKHWIPVIGEWPVREITTAKIKAVLAKLKVEPKTKRNILGPLCGVLDHAEINPNPAKAVRIRRAQKQAVDRYTPDQRSRLLSRLQGQALAYFALLLGCGLRPGGEPLALLWSDYDGEELEITKQITRRQKVNSTKTSKRRRVYVPTWVRPILNNLPSRHQGEHIFVNSFGGPFLDSDEFNRNWREAHRSARIPYRVPYACRHTRASELLSIGVEPADAAKQLGHSLEMFFRIYAEWIEEFGNKKDKSRFEGVGITHLCRRALTETLTG